MVVKAAIISKAKVAGYVYCAPIADHGLTRLRKDKATKVISAQRWPKNSSRKKPTSGFAWLLVISTRQESASQPRRLSRCTANDACQPMLM